VLKLRMDESSKDEVWDIIFPYILKRTLNNFACTSSMMYMFVWTNSRSFTFFRNVNDRTILEFLSFPSLFLANIRYLNLYRCESITEVGLAQLIDAMPSLTGISLEQCSQFQKEDQLLSLSKLNQLTDLNLSYCRSLSTPGNSSFISTLTSLTSLNVSGCLVMSQTFINELIYLTNLVKLELKGLKFPSSCLEIFTVVSNITHLDLTRCSRLSQDSLEYLAPLHNLRYLSVAGCDQLQAGGFQSLSHLTELRYLDLGYCKMQNGLTNIQHFTNLTYLSLWKCRINNETLRYLSRLINLTYLDLGDTQVTTSGLQFLTHLQNLKYLDVRQNNILEAQAKDLLKDINITDLLCASQFERVHDMQTRNYTM